MRGTCQDQVGIFPTTESHLDLHRVTEKLDVDDADLSASRFNNANLSRTTYNQIEFSGARVNDSNMTGCQVTDVNLSGATIRNANLSGVEIADCRLAGATIDGVAVEDLFEVYRRVKGEEV